MCTLAEPVPSLYFAWSGWDPSAVLFWAFFGTFVFKLLLLMVWPSPDSQHTWLSRKQAVQLLLGGYVCMLLMWHWGGVLAPYSSALDAWYQREQDVLTQACVAAVLTPAYHTARDVLETWTNVGLLVLILLGVLCMGVALWSRNIPGFIRQNSNLPRTPKSPPVY
jgi:hypothetical protein